MGICNWIVDKIIAHKVRAKDIGFVYNTISKLQKATDEISDKELKN